MSTTEKTEKIAVTVRQDGRKTRTFQLTSKSPESRGARWLRDNIPILAGIDAQTGRIDKGTLSIRGATLAELGLLPDGEEILVPSEAVSGTDPETAAKPSEKPAKKPSRKKKPRSGAAGAEYTPPAEEPTMAEPPVIADLETHVPFEDVELAPETLETLDQLINQPIPVEPEKLPEITPEIAEPSVPQVKDLTPASPPAAPPMPEVTGESVSPARQRATVPEKLTRSTVERKPRERLIELARENGLFADYSEAEIEGLTKKDLAKAIIKKLKL